MLHGPRGNGKTALLAWLQQEASAYPEIDVLRLTPADIPSEPKLVERLLPTSWLQRLAPKEVSVRGITWRAGGSAATSLDEVLAVRTRTKPLVLLLDEAHTLNTKVGYALLNASQKIGRDLPFLLVLAGTPGLPSHLNTMNASFWNRAERRPIGRLDSEATAAAIREPLEGERIAIDRDALERVVQASHGYPYFVQVWGQALWASDSGHGSTGNERPPHPSGDCGRPDRFRTGEEQLLSGPLRGTGTSAPVAGRTSGGGCLRRTTTSRRRRSRGGNSCGTSYLGRRRRNGEGQGRNTGPGLRVAAPGNSGVGARDPEPDGLRTHVHPHPRPVTATELAAWISITQQKVVPVRSISTRTPKSQETHRSWPSRA